MYEFGYIFNISLDTEWVSYILYIWRYEIRLPVIVLNVLLILLIFFLIFKVRPIQHRIRLVYWFKDIVGGRKIRKKDHKFIRQWHHGVVNRLSKPTPENLRLAVIDADTMVDMFLKKSGYSGEHMADRLSRIVPSEVRSLKSVWEAHILRNSLVHVPGSTVSASEAKSAITAFEDFLKELGGL